MSAGQGAGARPSAGDIVDALAGRAEDVCRKYLSKGRKVGGYWLVGNLANEPGSSLYVRLTAREGRAVGKFNDAATGQHGDLLDIIAAGEGSPPFPEVLDAARAFLGQTVCRGQANPRPGRQGGRARSTETIARDIHRRSHDAANTLAERYLRGRLFAGPIPYSLRYDPRCFYASGADGGPAEKWPAMIGAVTDLGGRLTGIHRTWLRKDGRGKAPVAEPKKTLGSINGHGVRFGSAGEAMFAGEGIETMLPVHMLDPDVCVVAATSSEHLAALILPAGLRRLYIVRDRDAAGMGAAATLGSRGEQAGVAVRMFDPVENDLNDDLASIGIGGIARRLAGVLHPSDRGLIS